MEEAHTPASYFIAIVAVLGGALMMPTFPIFIMIVCPLLLLGIVVYALLRRKQSNACKYIISSRVSAVSTYTQASTTPSNHIWQVAYGGGKRKESRAQP